MNYFSFTYIVLPHINPFSFEEDANSGDSVQLSCYISKGDLPLKITWLFNGKPIFAHLGIVTTAFGARSNMLTVPSLTGENGGTYTCVATNAAGSTNFSTALNVHGNL